MTRLSSSFAFSGVQKKWVGLVKEVQGGVGVGVGGCCRRDKARYWLSEGRDGWGLHAKR